MIQLLLCCYWIQTRRYQNGYRPILSRDNQTQLTTFFGGGVNEVQNDGSGRSARKAGNCRAMANILLHHDQYRILRSSLSSRSGHNLPR